ncbi:MAG TPA: phosphoenolpyruvate--protein phosphotransferase [Planctomycetes bacterium]|nr:phosphoenolpyruvate--protein phosphotransferase [Planctomycetota bacterium]HIN79640.1 phosphoenolpyruvate--protein phosphotransferase [Planctomycetota bacterium]
MELKKGIPVSPGIVIREAFALDTEDLRIPQRFIEKSQVEDEVERYEQAVVLAQKSLDKDIESLGTKIKIHTQILEIHRDLVADPVLRKEIIAAIRDKHYTAEHAVSRVLNRYIKKFAAMDSPIIAERVHDLFDIEKLILSTLLGKKIETLNTLEREVVVIAHNLTPAQTAKLDPRWVHGFATDVGGKTSHTAIMARALGIPAVVGLDDISTTVVGGDLVIIDGFRGIVLINPDERTVKEYQSKVEETARVTRRLRKQASLPAETIDGHALQVHANIELPQEVHSAVELGAEGIGLFRTEFIHLQTPRNNEEVHFQHYRNVLRELGNRPLTLRTLDLGGDKDDGLGLVEENPFLGCRSIRWCLEHPDVFRAQLRAIYRVSALGQIRVMLPMISSIPELDRTLMLIEEVKEELREENIPFDDDVPVGVMIEVPSLAVIADLVAPRVSFFSVGTNDLVQYTLAVDRGNERVAELYDPVHPAILRLLVRVLEVGDEHGIRVSVCGEMASEPIYLPLLIGLGLRELSVSPQLIPEVKQVIRLVRDFDVQELAHRCLDMSDGFAITRELRRWAHDHLPDLPRRW